MEVQDRGLDRSVLAEEMVTVQERQFLVPGKAGNKKPVGTVTGNLEKRTEDFSGAFPHLLLRAPEGIFQE